MIYGRVRVLPRAPIGFPDGLRYLESGVCAGNVPGSSGNGFPLLLALRVALDDPFSSLSRIEKLRNKAQGIAAASPWEQLRDDFAGISSAIAQPQHRCSAFIQPHNPGRISQQVKSQSTFGFQSPALTQPNPPRLPTATLHKEKRSTYRATLARDFFPRIALRTSV